MEPVAADAFRIACSCGQLLAGPRKPVHQELPCPRCGDLVFVLPKSPWDIAVPVRPRTHLRKRDWLLPASAMGLTMALLVAGYFVFLRRPSPSNGPTIGNGLAVVTVDGARQKMARGQFRQAQRDFDLLMAAKDSAPLEDLPQLAAEAGILADLISEPLDDILRGAAGLDEAEWQLQFESRYKGKSILLDAEFDRGDDGSIRCNHHLDAGKESARFDFAPVVLLRRLPLTKPERLVIGLRLDAIRLEAPGPTWVVRFAKDGGVLLTDPGAAKAVCPELGDEEGRKVLARQAAMR